MGLHGGLPWPWGGSEGEFAWEGRVPTNSAFLIGVLVVSSTCEFVWATSPATPLTGLVGPIKGIGSHRT